MGGTVEASKGTNENDVKIAHERAEADKEIMKYFAQMSANNQAQLANMHIGGDTAQIRNFVRDFNTSHGTNVSLTGSSFDSTVKRP
jgi:hypothetical protein